MATVLIVDDEANLRKVLGTLLQRDGHQTVCAAHGQLALEALRTHAIDIVVTDLKMPQMGGMELLQAIKALHPQLPVIVVTAHGTVDTAVSALKMGAFDYITKPFEREELKLAVRKAAAVRMTLSTRLQDTGDSRGRFRIIGQSPRMAEIYTVIAKVAPTPSTVLISGESGTGKELVASALHAASQRAHKPFIKVNCAAIPKDLMESEFFGYERGAFTGAVAAKPGRFELAHGGTLFLDEIAEIPQSMQVKLLRALQESEFERVGGVRTLRVDVRIVAASNCDLPACIAGGAFREDLYYRLNVVPIALPALRQRTEDIAVLAQHFLEKCGSRIGKPRGFALSEEALVALRAYAWPGNIRELENVIERTLLFVEHDIIVPDDLPEEIGGPYARMTLMPTAKTPQNHNVVPQGSAILEGSSGGAQDVGDGHASGYDLHSGNCNSMKDIVRRAGRDLERDLIQRALADTGGNVTHAAMALQISRKGLQNKMKEFGLRPA